MCAPGLKRLKKFLIKLQWRFHNELLLGRGPPPIESQLNFVLLQLQLKTALKNTFNTNLCSIVTGISIHKIIQTKTKHTI